MNYRLELLIHDESFNAYEKIEADSLTELLAQFLLVVARVTTLQQEQLKIDLFNARLVLKNHDLKEDDIPF